MAPITPHDHWLWARFVDLLDKAGYAIVKKPTIEKGIPRK